MFVLPGPDILAVFVRVFGLAYQAEIEAVGEDGWTALLLAALNGKEAAATMLIIKPKLT